LNQSIKYGSSSPSSRTLRLCRPNLYRSSSVPRRSSIRCTRCVPSTSHWRPSSPRRAWTWSSSSSRSSWSSRSSSRWSSSRWSLVLKESYPPLQPTTNHPPLHNNYT
ncbi:hypothetical protein SAMD00019534_053360, partial [Acytostelium subglobosum LB1]|uniref:hypothetical protein n=1 Tax=Acytostelium subglobosum LB1 TaxID=1410327 RepID=UPI000644CE15